MTRYKIVFKKKVCTEKNDCDALSNEFWKEEQDGNARFLAAFLDKKIGRYEIEAQDDIDKNRLIGSCPAHCIMISEI